MAGPAIVAHPRDQRRFETAPPRRNGNDRRSREIDSQARGGHAAAGSLPYRGGEKGKASHDRMHARKKKLSGVCEIGVPLFHSTLLTDDRRA